jgi:hypothetical protein
MPGERTRQQKPGLSRQKIQVSEILSFAGLVAQVRSAYTRSHPELGRETLQRP